MNIKINDLVLIKRHFWSRRQLAIIRDFFYITDGIIGVDIGDFNLLHYYYIKDVIFYPTFK